MIYTFYSYKGGVGRSMALANVGELFCRAGLNVLLVDWDLEAPGLERFLIDDASKMEEMTVHLGVVDMLLDYKHKMTQEWPTRDREFPFIKPSDLAIELYRDSSKGQLRLLTSGKRDRANFSRYANAVLTFDWKDFYERLEGEAYFEWLRQQFLEMADIVLIDSRTGITEMGGVCTYQLADVVIALCTANQQSLNGTYEVLSDLLRDEVREARGRPLKVFAIPARVEQSEGEFLNRFKREFLKLFEDIGKETLGITSEQLWDLGIPYIPHYAYEETCPVRESDAAIAQEISRAFKLLALMLSRLGNEGSKVRRAFPIIKTEQDSVTGYLVTDELIFIGESFAFVTDRDSDLIPDYEAVLYLLEQQAWYQACQKLMDLREKVQGSLISEVENALQKAQTALKIGTEKRILAAQRFAQKHPKDLTGQTTKWYDVITFNPGSVEAQVELDKIKRVSNAHTNALAKARHALAYLEEQAAGYTSLTIPAQLKIELEDKRRDVAELEEKLEVLEVKDWLSTILPASETEEITPVWFEQVGLSRNPFEPVWFERVGLSRNPFEHLTAEEDPALLLYQIQPQVLRPAERYIRGDDVISRWIVFGDEGFGKTALCKRIAQSHYPLKAQDEVLCIVYDAQALNTVLAYANYSLETLRSDHYVDVAYELVRDALGSLPALEKSPASDVSARQALNAITQAILSQGFRYLLCLVDQVDAVEIEIQPENILAFLKPLMRLDQLALSGWAFRYFLPSDLAPLMYAQQKTLHLSRYKILRLEWTEEDLERLIAQRLSTVSKSPLNPYTSLGQLCEPGANFGAPIDQALVRLAEGSPRAAVWLVNYLFELHCQTENPPRFIQPATWERVKMDWWAYGRNQLFGSPTQDEGFVLVGERIYFQGNEITLSKTSAALLCSLILAGERGCSKAELRQVGWPIERPEGVTEAALTEAIRRMKAELRKQGGDPRWIKTVRGQGYRLQKPEKV